MKKYFTFCLAIFILTQGHAQSVGIGTTTPNSDAMLDVQSTTKGMLIPRMSTTQRNAIPSPATGLLVFDNTTGSFWFKNPSRWVELVDSSNTIWTKTASNVYVNNGENVGIGTSSPDVRLQINNGTDISGATGGYLQLGGSDLVNLALDNNEIQARNNGASSQLILQNDGGNVRVGNSAGNNADLTIANGKITKPPTGVFNMMPLCYGKVAANGTIINATPNVFMTKSTTDPGVYFINCSGITASTIAIGTITDFIFEDRIINLVYSSTGTTTVSIIKASDGSEVNTSFSFVLYNQ